MHMTGGGVMHASETNLKICVSAPPRTLLYDPCVPVSVHSICDRTALPLSRSLGPAVSQISGISISASFQFDQPSRLGILASSSCFCGF